MFSCCNGPVRDYTPTLGVLVGGSNLGVITRELQQQLPQATVIHDASMYAPGSTVPLVGTPAEKLDVILTSALTAAKLTPTFIAMDDPLNIKSAKLAERLKGSNITLATCLVGTDLGKMPLDATELKHFGMYFQGCNKKMDSTLAHLSGRNFQQGVAGFAKRLGGTDDAVAQSKILGRFLGHSLSMTANGTYLEPRWSYDHIIQGKPVAIAAKIASVYKQLQQRPATVSKLTHPTTQSGGAATEVLHGTDFACNNCVEVDNCSPCGACLTGLLERLPHTHINN